MVATAGIRVRSGLQVVHVLPGSHTARNRDSLARLDDVGVLSANYTGGKYILLSRVLAHERVRLALQYVRGVYSISGRT